jgi:hypothetical protein
MMLRQSGIGWFYQRAKSETKVFPTFLFAGRNAIIAQLRAYECRFYSRTGILGA